MKRQTVRGAAVAALVACGLTVTVPVASAAACTLYGTPGDDVLSGTSGNDVICGYGGNDLLIGNGGDDAVYGGAGNDQVYAGDGNDKVYGESGNDLLAGESGNDTIEGLYGVDELSGMAGDDNLSGGSGGDFISGGDGLDILSGGDGNDTLEAEGGKDIAAGGLGDDFIRGGPDNDFLIGDLKVVAPSTGTLSFSATGGADTIYGDEAEDEVVGDFIVLDTVEAETYDGYVSYVNVTGGADTIRSGSADPERCMECEVHGDSVVDIFFHDSSVTVRGANDLIMDHNSDIYADNEVNFADTPVVPASGAVYIYNGSDSVSATTGAYAYLDSYVWMEEGDYSEIVEVYSDGSDTYAGGSSHDWAFGDTWYWDNGTSFCAEIRHGGSDVMTGGEEGDLLSGDAGADSLDGGPGPDSLWGDITYQDSENCGQLEPTGAGVDTFLAGPGDDYIDSNDDLVDTIPVDGGDGNDRASVDSVDVLTSIEYSY